MPKHKFCMINTPEKASPCPLKGTDKPCNEICDIAKDWEKSPESFIICKDYSDEPD